jgi:hypothetical protein
MRWVAPQPFHPTSGAPCAMPPMPGVYLATCPNGHEWRATGTVALAWTGEPERAHVDPPAPARDLPPEIREILRDAAKGVSGVCIRERAAAAIVARDLCPRCAGTGMELLDTGPGGPAAWGTCHGCRAPEVKP